MIDPNAIESLYPFTLDEIERAVLLDRYAQCAGDLKKTADSLGLSSVAVKYKLVRLGVLPDLGKRLTPVRVA